MAYFARWITYSELTMGITIAAKVIIGASAISNVYT